MTDPAPRLPGELLLPDDVVPSGWFVARVPLVSFDEVQAWACLVAEDRTVPLPAAFDRPEVIEAVFLAAPGLVRHLRRPGPSAGPPDVREARSTRRAERALVRYFLRMAARSTPFGLFATVSVGRLGTGTNIVVAPVGQIRRRTRLDSGLLTTVVEALRQETPTPSPIRLRPNPTLYRVGDRLRFVDHRAGPALAGTGRLGIDRAGGVAAPGYYLSSVAVSPALTTLIHLARSGEASADSLIDALTRDGHSTGTARGFVRELIDTQVLLDDLAPPVTGGDPLRYVMDRMPPNDVGGRVLGSVAAILAEFDRRGAGIPVDEYRQVVKTISGVPGGAEPPSPFHVDAVRPGKGSTLGVDALEAIRHGTEVLRRVGHPWRDRNLDQFRDAFVERFQSQRVPLLLALDEDYGAGRGLTAPAEAHEGMVRPGRAVVPWGRRERHLTVLLHRAWSSGTFEVRLSHGDLEAMATPDPLPLPEAFAVLATVSTGNGSPQVLVDCAVGPSGVRLVGRLCDLDPALRGAVRNHLAAEERLHPDKIFAEIVHDPSGGLGNVVRRPELRSWAIPVLQRSGLPERQQIRLEDLSIAVTRNRIRLYSDSLGREVLPRLSNAHDYYSAPLGIYRFLGAVQSEGVAGTIRWSWGPFEGAPFLPRLVSGRAVIARARWTLTRTELNSLFDGHGRLRHDRLAELRIRRDLPRFVHVDDPAGPILLDLGNPNAAAAVAPLFRGRPSVALDEMWPEPGNLAAHGAEGRFVSEVVVPFVREPSERAAATEGAAVTAETSGTAARTWAPAGTWALPGPVEANDGFRRDLPPGSEWVSVKVYAGAPEVDRLLVGPISDMTIDPAGGASCWFFLRYADPRPHLRLRLRAHSPDAAQAIRRRLDSTLAGEFDRGTITDIVYDTYRREVERYGGADGILLAEQVFHADSVAALAALPFVLGDDCQERRFVSALFGVDRLLAGLGFDLAGRRRVIGGLRRSLDREFRVGRNERAEILARFRPLRQELLRVVNGIQVPALLPDAVRQAFAQRRRTIDPAREALWNIAARGKLTTSVDSWAASLAHLCVNRLMRDAPRRHELDLTTFLDRLYESSLARRGPPTPGRY